MKFRAPFTKSEQGSYDKQLESGHKQSDWDGIFGDDADTFQQGMDQDTTDKGTQPEVESKPEPVDVEAEPVESGSAEDQRHNKAFERLNSSERDGLLKRVQKGERNEGDIELVYLIGVYSSTVLFKFYLDLLNKLLEQARQEKQERDPEYKGLSKLTRFMMYEKYTSEHARTFTFAPDTFPKFELTLRSFIRGTLARDSFAGWFLYKHYPHLLKDKTQQIPETRTKTDTSHVEVDDFYNHFSLDNE